MNAWQAVRQRMAEQKRNRRESKIAADLENSPEGRARAARERGDEVFQLEIGTSEFNAVTHHHNGHFAGPTDIVGRVEAIGWCLDRVGYVSSGEGAVRGIYLFRNAERMHHAAHSRPRPGPF